MKKRTLLSFACAAAILFSCSEAPNNGNYVDKTGTLLVTAKDFNTGNLITDVEATFIGVDKLSKTRKSNSKGVVSINEIPVGTNYLVRVTAAGYAPMICAFSIVPEMINPNANIFASQDAAITAELVKTGATVTGYADYQNPKINTNYATDLSPANATVQLVLNGGTNCQFEQRVVETTAVEGIFEFANMPELTDFTANFLQFTVEDVILSAASKVGTTGFSGSTAVVGTVANPNTYNTRVESTMQMLECHGTVKSETAEVKIVFNKNIKDSDDERIFGISPINAVPPNTTISGNTLTVKPGTGGEWDAFGDTITGRVCSSEFNVSCVTVNCPIIVED